MHLSPMPEAQPRLSDRARRLSGAWLPDAWAIPVQAGDDARAGRDIVQLTLGDPVQPPHPAIRAATCAAIEAGRTHYSPLSGEPALRAVIARQEGVSVGQVSVQPGAQHAGLAVLSLLVGEGDEVIIADPHYSTYLAVLATAGARPVVVPCRPDLGLDIEAVARAITPATRAIFLSSPANPTGAALTPGDYAALSEIAHRHDLWIVVDEVYSTFRFDGLSVRAWEHGPKGRTVSLNSLSKSHAMTGYRVGWALAPEPLVQALDDWGAAAHFSVSQFIQDAAVAALSLPPSEFDAYRSGFKSRAAYVVERVNACAGLSANMPAGGMFVLADCTAANPDDLEFVRQLYQATGVALVPGSAFGNGGRGHVRISLTPELATLELAFDRISGFLKAR